jgi:hypothetical protein
LDGKSWDLEEIEKQIEITRNLRGKLSLGNIFFSMKAFTTNRQGIFDKFPTSVYAKPALVPAMSWRSAAIPTPVTQLTVKQGQLTWQMANNSNIRSWTLYKQNGTNWTLEQVLAGETRLVNLALGTYALCAVDQMANESMGVVVSVS